MRDDRTHDVNDGKIERAKDAALGKHDSNPDAGDLVGEAAGGVSGVLAGAAIGSVGGPVGTIIGGIAGAVGGFAMQAFSAGFQAFPVHLGAEQTNFSVISTESFHSFENRLTIMQGVH